MIQRSLIRPGLIGLRTKIIGVPTIGLPTVIPLRFSMINIILYTHSCAGPTSRFCVWATPSVQGTSPTLTVTWHALASGAVTYTVKYSTQPGEVNTPPEGALEVTGISGTSTILTALKKGTTYYIWVVGVSEGREGLRSDRTIGVTYDSELDSINIALQKECKICT